MGCLMSHVVGGKSELIPAGLRYHTLDLHIHTPASRCFADKTVTAKQIVDAAVSTPDIEAAHNQLKHDGASQIADDLYGPGSGVKWFSVDDPENNHWMIVQATKRDGHES
jgi:uncharacterized glyoxalase superfamily protein PhnB